MRKIALLALLVLAPFYANAIPPGWLKRPSKTSKTIDTIDLSAVTPGCYANGATVAGHTLTISRAGITSYIAADGSLADCQANETPVTGWGVVGQTSRTNAVVSPESPAAQDIALGAGFQWLASRGTGSVTWTLVSGTAANLPCTSTTGISCLAVVTGSATVHLAPTGTISYATAELNGGGGEGVPIRNGTRNTDWPIFSSPNMALTDLHNWCVRARTHDQWHTVLSPWNVAMWRWGTDSQNFAELRSGGFSITGGGSGKVCQYALPRVGTSASDSFVACSIKDQMQVWMYADDAPHYPSPAWLPITCSYAGAGDGILKAAPTASMVLGSGMTSEPGGVWVSQVQICQGPNALAKCQNLGTPSTYYGASFGDSITAAAVCGNPRTNQGCPAYPHVASNVAGPPWSIMNLGVSGDWIDHVKANIQANLPGPFSFATIMAGSNDMYASSNLAGIPDQISAMLDAAVASGVRVIPLTIPPNAGLTGPQRAALAASNQRIYDYCDAHGLTCVGMNRLLDDGTGAIKTEYYGTEALHPGALGQEAMGRLLAVAVKSGPACTTAAITATAPCLCGNKAEASGYCCSGTWNSAPCETITSYAADPTFITRGSSSTLSWATTGATSCSIDHGVGSVSCTGTASVSPTTSTVYTLTATNAYGSVTGTATVSLYPYVIAEDAYTYSHNYFDGSSIVSSGAVEFTAVGTPPQVAASGAIPAGAGPFSSSNYYTAGDNLEQHGDFSVCALVTVANYTTDQEIITKDGTSGQRNFALEHYGSAGHANRTFVFKTGASYAVQQVDPRPTGGVHLYCFSYDYVTDGTSVLQVFIDNATASITNGAGPPQTTTAPLYIGRRAIDSNQPWTGYIHEIEMWSRALSAADVTAIYTSLHSAGII
jgi:hypothetical protein